MKAICIGTGPERALSWTEVPTPEPGPDEVRIRVHATAVNRADLLQRKGLYNPPPGASAIMGLEAAGVIDALGEGVTEFQLGEPVCALLAGGGYAEFVTVPAGQVLPIPKGVTLTQAAAIPEVFATATINLIFEGQLQPGERVLLHAGASGVGTAAIQLCKAWGNPVYVTAGNNDNIQRWIARGASGGAYRHTECCAEQVHRWTNGSGFDVILDPVGGSYLEHNLKSLTLGGRLIVIGLMGGRNAPLDLGRLLMKRQRIIGSTLRSRPVPEKTRLMAWMHTHIWPLFERKHIQPIICATHAITAVESAHELIRSNTTVGKVILTIP